MPDRIDPTLIRLHCDGELTPEQAAALEHYLQVNPQQRSAVREKVDFERALKAHVGAVMRECPAAPSELAEQIRSGMTPDIAGRIGSDTTHTSNRAANRGQSFFLNTSRANVLAIAATLALIAGAVLYGIFGRTIDDLAPRATGDLISDAAGFIDTEHTATARTVAREPMGATHAMIIEAEAALSDWLGSAVSIFDLQPVGYEFVSASHSGMPVPAKSAHLLYRKIVDPGQRAPLLSVFIVRDSGRCGEKLCAGIDKGKWCCLSESGVKCKRRILRGTDGKLVYFLVCCNENDLEPVTHRIQLASSASSSQ